MFKEHWNLIFSLLIGLSTTAIWGLTRNLYNKIIFSILSIYALHSMFFTKFSEDYAKYHLSVPLVLLCIYAILARIFRGKFEVIPKSEKIGSPTKIVEKDALTILIKHIEEGSPTSAKTIYDLTRTFDEAGDIYMGWDASNYIEKLGSKIEYWIENDFETIAISALHSISIVATAIKLESGKEILNKKQKLVVDRPALFKEKLNIVNAINIALENHQIGKKEYERFPF